MNFSHEFWVQIAVYVVGGFFFVAINAFKIGQLEAKLATKDELKSKVDDRNKMIDRVYERFDEHKKDCSEWYVRKDMCGQLHLSAKDEMDRMDKDYKDFRHEIRNTVQMIFDKIDEINRRLNEKA